MNQQLMMVIAGAATLALGGAMMIWWLTGRLKNSALRKVTRILGLPILLIAVAVGGFLMARSEVQLLPQATPLTVVSETEAVKLGALTQTLSSTGSLDAADEKTLTFAESAPVTAVNVKAGDTVTKGEVLATVDTTDIDAQIASAQLNLDSANDALDALEAPATDLEVQSAKLAVDAAEASLSSASESGASSTDKQIAEYQEELAKNSLWQAQLQRDESSVNANPNAPNAYASSVETAASLASDETNVEIQTDATTSTLNETADASQLSSANAQLTSAQASLNELLDGASDTDLAQAKITVQTAQLALDTAEAAKTNAEIVAPFDGVVAAVGYTVGAMPGSGSITLLDTSHYTITLSVDEKDITQLAVGQKVDLTITALGNASLTGTVTTVDPVPTTSNNLVTYSVEVTLDSTTAAVRPGMSAVADIILNSESNVIVIPNRFITTNATTSKSTVKVETAPGVYTVTPVTLGSTTDSESVVTSGLSVGQTIVIETTASSGSISSTQSNSLGLLGGLSGGAGGPPGGGSGGPPSGGNFGGGGGRGG